MFPRWMVLGAFGGCLLLAVACSRPDSGSASVEPAGKKPAATKQSAPGIEGEMLDGSPFSLKEKYATNVIMLDFWATWCGPCVMELPILIKLADEYQSRGVALYAVNGGEDVETVRDFLKERNWSFNVVMDASGKHADAYQVGGIPHLVLIDKQGTIRKVQVGYSPEAESELRHDLDEILADSGNTATQTPR